MSIKQLITTLIFAVIPVSLYCKTSIADIARQFHDRQIDVDSLFNYMDNHHNEVYWWALYNSEKEDPMANYILGRCYLTGIGTSEDNSQAKSSFDKALKLGIDEALVDLGQIYINGLGVEQDSIKGIQLFKQAADKKIPRGLIDLGIICFQQKQYKKAFALSKNAADLGYSGGFLEVGYMYDCGYGVEPDSIKALENYLKAAEKGSQMGLYNVGLAYEFGKSVDQDHEKALNYYKASAAKGYAPGAYKVGYIIQYGDIDILEDVSYEKAAEWYTISAEKDYKPAKVELAFLYFDGLGVEENKPKALDILESVGTENVRAGDACIIADYYMDINPSKALEWAKAAYENKVDEDPSYAEPAKLLGLLYLKGGKEIYDYELAVKYLREGAEWEQPECVALMKSLGEPFEEAVQATSPGFSE